MSRTMAQGETSTVTRCGVTRDVEEPRGWASCGHIPTPGTAGWAHSGVRHYMARLRRPAFNEWETACASRLLLEATTLTWIFLTDWSSFGQHFGATIGRTAAATIRWSLPCHWGFVMLHQARPPDSGEFLIAGSLTQRGGKTAKALENVPQIWQVF
jgi:hypothetical protein